MISGLFGEDEAMSDAAVLEAIRGGIELALDEMQQTHGDLDSWEDGYGPGDFESPEDAFHALVEMLEHDDQ